MPTIPSPKSSVTFVLFATSVTAIGGFLFGYDTAVINGANSYLKAYMHLNPTQEGLAGASAILGCIPGAMFAGFLSDRFGRKRLLFLCAIALCGFRPAFGDSLHLRQFLVARIISGLGHRRILDDLSRLYRRNCAGKMARPAGNAFSSSAL